MSVTNAFNESVAAAIESGALDEKAHGAAIEAARKLAGMMDSPEWPMVNGKLDNVSPGVFLKYCNSLGLVPGETASKPKEAAVKSVSIVGNSKWAQKRAANG